MEPNIHQPDSLDGSTPLGSNLHGNSGGIQTSDVATGEAQFAKDWQYAKKALLSRWQGLTSDDFAAADGDRDRFVERLASRGGISQFKASNDLTAFEAHQPIHWRHRVPANWSKQ